MSTTANVRAHARRRSRNVTAVPRTIRVSLLSAFLLVLGACGGGTPADTPAVEPPAADVVLRVIVDDRVAADWTLDALTKAVSSVELDIDGDAQSGPRLLDVLSASGVGDWKTARVFGMGEGRTVAVELDIASSDVDEGWVLDVTNRGTLKLAAAGLERQQWVRDVGEIRIP